MKEAFITLRYGMINYSEKNYRITINKTNSGYAGNLYSMDPENVAVGGPVPPEGRYVGRWFWGKTFKFPSYIFDAYRGATITSMKKGICGWDYQMIMLIKNAVERHIERGEI